MKEKTKVFRMLSTGRLVCPGITQAILCVALLSGLSSCIYQYYLIEEKITWLEAQNHCKANYTDLASADSIQDMQRIVASANSGYIGTVWIGLYDNSLAWSWSMPDDGFYGMVNISFSMWEVGQPNKVKNQGELCGAVQMGFWHDNYCNSSSPFVCYDNTLGSSSERYVFVNQTVTWHEAVAYCRLHHTDLASVRNQMESTEIQRVVPSEIMVSIGLYRPTWIWWSDGIMRSFKYWQSNQPSNATACCAGSRIDPNTPGMWFDLSCDKLHHFVCHKFTKQRFHLKLTALKSAGDLNDPVVTEAILKLLEKKLNDKGVPGGFSIVWKTGPDGKVFHAEEKKSLEKTCV